MINPVLSVIVPAKHANGEILKTYESLKPFLGNGVELVVQDYKGESLLGYIGCIKGVTVLNHEDTGTANAVNLAIKAATGDYLLFWGAGEIGLAEGFVKAFHDLCQGSYDILFNCIKIMGASNIYKPQPEHIESTMSCLTPGAMIARKFFDQSCGELDERYEIANDYAMFVKLLKHKPTYAVTDHVIVDYGLDGMSSESRMLEGIVECELIRMREYKKNTLVAAMDLGLLCGNYVRQRTRIA